MTRRGQEKIKCHGGLAGNTCRYGTWGEMRGLQECQGHIHYASSWMLRAVIICSGMQQAMFAVVGVGNAARSVDDDMIFR